MGKLIKLSWLEEPAGGDAIPGGLPHWQVRHLARAKAKANTNTPPDKSAGHGHSKG